jgi:hypothetical protein
MLCAYELAANEVADILGNLNIDILVVTVQND